MKKLFFPAVAALALGLASCSSDNVGPDGGGQPSFAEGGYAKVAIALPTQNGDSRAADGDQADFNDGLASEYKVYDAKLILFQGGENENDAVFHSAYNLPVSMDMDKNEQQITATTKIVSRLKDGANLHGSKLYALVVLNSNGFFTVGADNSLTLTNGTSAPFTGTIAALQSTVVAAGNDERYGEKFTKNGFLMLNAPLADAPGAYVSAVPRANVKTLADFSDAVYKTEAEALQHSATEIFVERAVSKVTMAENLQGILKTSGMTVDGPAGASTDNPEWKVVGWDLDVTNNSSYLVRNTKSSYNWNGLKAEGLANYRFIGDKNVKANTTLYRTYWAIDPNYGGLNEPSYAFDKNDFSYVAPDYTAFSTNFGDDAPKYCFENTFDVAHQNKQETTRAIVKVKIGQNGTFYTVNGDKSHLYTEATLKDRVYAAVLNEPVVANWLKNNGGSSNAADHGITFDGLDTRDNTTGKITVSTLRVKSATNISKDFQLTDFFADPTGKTFNDALGLGDILSYEGGYAYYPIRIKHFGDDLTPWNKNETKKPTAGGTTADTYPGTDAVAANNYLGRYGVLRNNWYNIAVTSISGLGDAVVPKVDSDSSTDDDLYNYIAVRINILSWAKRQQNADL